MDTITFHNNGFETSVRKALGKMSGEITSDDLLNIREIIVEWGADDEEIEILKKCHNLEILDIQTDKSNLEFLSSFTHLKELYLESADDIDFNNLICLRELYRLCASGVLFSDIKFNNTEALELLPELKDLSLCDFGQCNLRFLRWLPDLKLFCCGWANEIFSADSIAYLKILEHLDLVDISVDNLDFLDELPDSLSLELCAVDVRDGFDSEKLQRFRELDVCEMLVGGKRINLEILKKAQSGKNTD